jgi:hypothetical protein
MNRPKEPIQPKVINKKNLEEFYNYFHTDKGADFTNFDKTDVDNLIKDIDNLCEYTELYAIYDTYNNNFNSVFLNPKLDAKVLLDLNNITKQVCLHYMELHSTYHIEIQRLFVDMLPLWYRKQIAD